MAKAAGLSWPRPAELDDATLEARLYPADSRPRARPLPDFKRMHAELRKKGVTLELLWQEYRAVHPDGYGYSRFTDLFREFCGQLDLIMHQTHQPGEKLFVDFAGPTLPITDSLTGEVRQAAVFVAAMGASSFRYAEDRHGATSTLVASQLPTDAWHKYVGDPTVADAILDRLVHNAHQLELQGESMRKSRANLTPSNTSDK